MERQGIPTITLVAEDFAVYARLQVKALGVPDMRLVIVPSPIHNRTAEEMSVIAEAAARDVVAQLTRPLPGQET